MAASTSRPGAEAREHVRRITPKQLIVQLTRPESAFALRRRDDWSIECEQYPREPLGHLNDLLAKNRESPGAVRLEQSFPRYVRRLRRVHEDPGRPLTDQALALFFRLTFSPETEEGTLEERAEELQAQELVERVTRAAIIWPAAFEQGYARPSTQGGVDAELLWGSDLPGWRGEQVQVCVIDARYDWDHPDLPSASVLEYGLGPVPGVSPDKNHCTRCLGILVAQDPPQPVTGLVPGLKKCWVCSSTILSAQVLAEIETAVRAALDLPIDLPDSLDVAFSQLNLEPGDVLLLPLQADTGKPIESDLDIFDLFANGQYGAAGRGIVVVEAAGNKGFELALGNPAIPHGDSGAIIVGAGYADGDNALGPVVNHVQLFSSGWGPRVDCQGWGEKIATTQFDPPKYDESFGGTSGASSIVAGVVAAVQSIHQEAGKGPIPPDDLRARLRDPQLGRLPASGSLDIGPLPDIRRLLGHYELLPDSFLRDHLQDTGDPTYGTTVYRSPDIIPRRLQQDHPQGAFNINDWQSDHGEDLVQGVEGYIYLRVQNRGPFRSRPKLRLYWAYPSLFLSPSTWTLITPQEIELVVPEAGGAVPGRAVAAPVPWTPPTNTTHPCLIAVVSEFHDELQIDANTIDGDFVGFVQKHNNVAYRNLTTVEATGDDQGGGLFFWRFGIRAPRVRGKEPTFLKIATDPALGGRWFIGLPSDRQSLLKAEELPERRPLAGMIGNGDEQFGADRRVVEARLAKPFGDRRKLQEPPDWLPMGSTRSFSGEVLLKPGSAASLTIGVRPGAVARPVQDAIVVEQYLGDLKVGALTLEVRSRG